METPVAIPFNNVTGEQVISGGVAVRAVRFLDRRQSWDARIGIYLHALGDRISHRVCTDADTITPPSPDRPEFRIDLNKPTCDQGPHAIRHEYETGVDFAGLEPGDRTTEAMLSMVYDELVAFAPGPRTLDGSARASPRPRRHSFSDGLGAGICVIRETGRADDRGDRGRLPGRGGAVPGHADLPCLTVSVVSRPVVIARHSPQ